MNKKFADHTGEGSPNMIRASKTPLANRERNDLTANRFLLGCLLTITLLVSGAGCAQTVYFVDLWPTESSLRRTLKIVVKSPTPVDQLSDEERSCLRSAYDLDDAIIITGESVFEGEFADRMPDDIGGYGTYAQFPSSLGTTRFYCERFRGSLDLSESLQQQQKALDDAIDLVGGWMTWKDDTAQAEQIGQWIDTKFRYDSQKLLLAVWTFSAAAQIGNEQNEILEDIQANALTFFAQFALEKQYMGVADAPRLARVLATNDAALSCKFAHDLLLRKLEIDLGIDASPQLAILRNPDEAAESLSRYIRTTEMYDQFVSERVTKRRRSVAKESAPEPIQLILSRLFTAILPSLWNHGDSVSVKLHLTGPPDHTNGKWDAQSGVVLWQRTLKRSPIPTMAMASWSDPDVAFQTRLFGLARIEGKHLSIHAIWYNGLTATERGHWDALMQKATARRESSPGQSASESWKIVVDELDRANADGDTEFPHLRTEAQRINEIIQ